MMEQKKYEITGVFAMPTNRGFILQWAAKGIGFGEVTFTKKEDKWYCHTECMSEEFVQAVFAAWLKTMEIQH